MNIVVLSILIGYLIGLVVLVLVEIRVEKKGNEVYERYMKKIMSAYSAVIPIIAALISTGVTKEETMIRMQTYTTDGIQPYKGEISSVDNDLQNRFTYETQDDSSAETTGDVEKEVCDLVVESRNDVFYATQAFGVRYKVRNVTKGDTDWSSYVYADIGDVVEYQVEYINTSDYHTDDVIAKVWLPENEQYIEGSTVLYPNLPTKLYTV